MKKTRLLVSITALTLSIALMGCQANGSGTSNSGSNVESVQVEQSGFPIVKESMEMSLMSPGTGLKEWKDLPVWKEYEKMTNIKMKFSTPPSSDFGTKLNLAFASDDLPDIIFGATSSYLTTAMESDYGSQGILLPLEDLIDKYAPNLKKLLDEYPEIRKNITATDGHIYSLPRISREDTSIWQRGPLWYNGSWLKALGVTELPENIDEFHDLMVRFKNEDPNGNGKQDELPISDVKFTHFKAWFLQAFGIKQLSIEEKDGEVRYAPITDEYKGYIEYMNKLWNEGLIDKEVYSQSDDQKAAKGKENLVGFFQAFGPHQFLGQNETEGMENPMWAPLTSEYQKEPLMTASPRMSRGLFSITHKCENPEAAMRWVDYFYSDEGDDFMNKGPEGEYWKYETNDAGEKVRVFGDNVDPEDPEASRGEYSPDYGTLLPGYKSSYEVNDIQRILTDKNEEDKMSAYDEWALKETEEKITPYAEVPFPLVYLTEEELDTVGATATDLSTYVEQMEAKFITGVEPLSNWDKYVETIKSMGVDKYVDAYKAAYERWEKAK